MNDLRCQCITEARRECTEISDVGVLDFSQSYKPFVAFVGFSFTC